jgi:hypothetical protein
MIINYIERYKVPVSSGGTVVGWGFETLSSGNENAP